MVLTQFATSAPVTPLTHRAPPQRLAQARRPPVIMAEVHQDRPGRTQLANDLNRHAISLEKTKGISQAKWALCTAAALSRYNGTENALMNLPKDATPRQQQRAQRNLAFELAQLSRVLQRAQSGAYGALPSEAFAERLALAHLAMRLRKQELKQPPPVPNLAPAPPNLLAWLQTAVAQTQEQQLNVQATAWLQAMDHALTAIAASEAHLANPRTIEDARKEAAQQLVTSLNDLSEHIACVPHTLSTIGWDGVAQRARVYLALRCTELSLLA